MPTYEFKTDNDECVEEMMTISEYERRFGGLGGRGRLGDGRRAVSILSTSPSAPGSGRQSASRYPYYSTALGCHPDQRAEMAKALAGMGCPTEIRADGDIKVESPGHLRKLHRINQCHDTNGTF